MALFSAEARMSAMSAAGTEGGHAAPEESQGDGFVIAEGDQRQLSGGFPAKFEGA